MAEVKLLKKVGSHEKGTVLNIEDKAVLNKWQELGVIDNSKKESKPKTEK